MGHRNISLTTPAGVFDGTDRIRQDVNMVTARINYRWVTRSSRGTDLISISSKLKPRHGPGLFCVCH
jgi:hypothetical protein